MIDTITGDAILAGRQFPDLSQLSHAEECVDPGAVGAGTSADGLCGSELKRGGTRAGSLGRKGVGRPLVCDPDAMVIAKAATCGHSHAALSDAEQVLHGR
jgi:hypothetical protein